MTSRKKLIIIAVFFAVCVGVWVVSATQGDGQTGWESLFLEQVGGNLASLRSAIDARPATSFIVGLAAFVGVSMIPGTRGKAVVVGWLFGFWSGLVIVNVGLTIAAFIAFEISRRFLRNALSARYQYYVDTLDRMLARDGVWYLFIMRLTGVAPYSLVNYVSGATKVSARDFWWTTQCGLLPGNFLFVFFGAHLPTLEDFSETGVLAILNPELIAALIALALMPLIVQRVVRPRKIEVNDRSLDHPTTSESARSDFDSHSDRHDQPAKQNAHE